MSQEGTATQVDECLGDLGPEPTARACRDDDDTDADAAPGSVGDVS
jgi:hypothetical protein